MYCSNIFVYGVLETSTGHNSQNYRRVQSELNGGMWTKRTSFRKLMLPHEKINEKSRIQSDVRNNFILKEASKNLYVKLKNVNTLVRFLLQFRM